ncbi:hypothetical protein ACG2F4_04620 [Halalkalibaculum sp. DA3122]|uniref:hypothetical protein n=1 Tax=unclassified Halalkalibaculum TaxID=2964617 RepID=UPI0037548723
MEQNIMPANQLSIKLRETAQLYHNGLQWLNMRELQTFFVAFIFAIGVSLVPKNVYAQNGSDHISVNNIDYYYEIHGEGKPLLLLQGGGQRDAGWDGGICRKPAWLFSRANALYNICCTRISRNGCALP